MLNVIREPKPTIAFSAQEEFVDLTPGVFTKRLDLEIEGTIDVAGGAASSDLLAEHIQRLLTSVRVVHDGEELVDLDGRLLVALSRRDVARALNFTELADLAVQTTAFRAKFRIPFERHWLADPFNTVLPPASVRQEFRLFVEWEQDVINAGDDAGTAAFGSPGTGDRTVTFTDGPRLRVVQVYAETGVPPWWQPRYSSFEVDRFTAADARLQAEIRRAAIVDSILVASRENVDADPTDAMVNDLTFRGGSRRFIDALRWDLLQDADQEESPGLDATVGYAMIKLADGGKLGNAVNLRNVVNPLLEFDVDAPTAGNGQITVVLNELHAIPGVTRKGSAGDGAGGRGRGR